MKQFDCPLPTYDCKPECGRPDFPGMCPPQERPIPCIPPAPSVVEGQSLYEAVNSLSNRVNTCINTYNNVMANCYQTLHNLERAAQENGAYYGPCEVWTEQGYYADESATYTLIHKACVDRRGDPIRMDLHLAYGNTTNSQVTQGLFSASKITFADKVVTAVPLAAGRGWYGNAIWNGAPIASASEPTLYTVGFTKRGVMRVYSNAVTVDQMLRDTIENAMGCPGVLIQQGAITTESWQANIPNRTEQVARIVMGQNLDTMEVIFLVCGNENDVNRKGMTSAACANVLLQYGCDIAVELTEAANAGACDKGSLMFIPDDANVPETYAFWYISRKCFYKTDYERELAELMQNYGKNIWETFLNYERIKQLRADLTKEISDREAADSVLQEQILAEVDNRVKADEVLQNQILAEVTNRENADKVLQDQILAEVTNRENADKVLQDQILAEVDNRANADEVLQGQITTEVANRVAADENLQNQITTEVNARVAADTSLQTDINNEVKNRTDADEVLQNQITKEIQDRVDADAVLQQAILTEQGARAAADEVLQTNINNEAATRATEDGKLQAAIDAEVTARTEADTALDTKLQGNIDALAARVTTAETDIDQLQSLYNDLQQQTSAMDLAITAIQKTITDIETSLNNLKETVEGIRNGTIVLPYVKKSGDTMTGSLEINGTGTNLSVVNESNSSSLRAKELRVGNIVDGANTYSPVLISSVGNSGSMIVTDYSTPNVSYGTNIAPNEITGIVEEPADDALFFSTRVKSEQPQRKFGITTTHITAVSNQIKEVGDPADAQDAVTLSYLNAHVSANAVQKTGDTMTGGLTIESTVTTEKGLTLTQPNESGNIAAKTEIIPHANIVSGLISAPDTYIAGLYGYASIEIGTPYGTGPFDNWTFSPIRLFALEGSGSIQFSEAKTSDPYAYIAAGEASPASGSNPATPRFINISSDNVLINTNSESLSDINNPIHLEAAHYDANVRVTDGSIVINNMTGNQNITIDSKQDIALTSVGNVTVNGNVLKETFLPASSPREYTFTEQGGALTATTGISFFFPALAIYDMCIAITPFSMYTVTPGLHNMVATITDVNVTMIQERYPGKYTFVGGTCLENNNNFYNVYCNLNLTAKTITLSIKTDATADLTAGKMSIFLASV